MTDPLFDLSGKTALVSGASRGIGEAIAHLLAAHGAHVICTSRKLEGCEAVASQIRAAGGSAEAHAVHVGDPAAIEGLFEKLDAAGRALYFTRAPVPFWRDAPVAGALPPRRSPPSPWRWWGWAWLRAWLRANWDRA